MTVKLKERGNAILKNPQKSPKKNHHEGNDYWD